MKIDIFSRERPILENFQRSQRIFSEVGREFWKGGKRIIAFGGMDAPAVQEALYEAL